MSDDDKTRHPPEGENEPGEAVAADEQANAGTGAPSEPSSPSRSHRAAAEAAEEAFFTDAQPAPGAGAGAGAGSIDDDEIDPELLALPMKRRRRHPIIAVAVIALSGYMLLHVHRDLFFYLQSSEPKNLGHATEALAANKLEENTFVRIEGAPDRKHALLLQGRFTGYESFFRLQRTNNRIFVQRHRISRTTEREVAYDHVGRLLRFDSLPYGKNLRAELARRITAAHDLSFETVRDAKAKGGGPATVVDRRGVRVTIKPSQLVWVNARYPDEWVIQLSKRAYQEEQARTLVESFGLTYAVDDVPSRLFYRYVVIATDATIKPAMDKLKDVKLHAGVVPRVVAYTTRWSDIRIEGDRLLLALDEDDEVPARYELVTASSDASAKPTAKLQPRRERPLSIAKGDLQEVTVGGKFVVPADAMVLLAGEAPGKNAYALVVSLLLSIFIVLNIIALVARWRSRRPKPTS